MADVLTKKQRSYNMSQIKSKDTKPELCLRKILLLSKIKNFRTNYVLPGKPDLVFAKNKLAIFIDGCFWHKCPKCFVKPATRSKFWEEKIKKNVSRDKEINKTIRGLGWKILRFWEHEINMNPGKVVKKIAKKLKL